MVRRVAGINIPVFSLRTKKSLGVGEFLDLIPFIDWAKEGGFKRIQILPVHDTALSESFTESNPYSILSVFSLHPLYINIQSLGEFDDEFYHPFIQELNQPGLDYMRTYKTKKELLKMLFVIRGERDLETKSFQHFFAHNEAHLKAYAAFCFLRDKYRTPDFEKWGKYSHYSEELIHEICSENDVSFFYFVQYHLDKQFKEVVKYARKSGVTLMGDFPIGIHRHSVEAWRFYDYFRWDKSIGAPPDFYNNLGQNWLFPSYDWEKIKQDNYLWLKGRLKWMERYFDAIRLDHVLGYFRLWEIPEEEVRGLMGNFFPSHGYSKEELMHAGIKDPIKLSKPYKPLPKGLESQIQVENKIKEGSEKGKLFSEIENRIFLYREGSFHPRIDVKRTEFFKSCDKHTQSIILQLFDNYYNERQERLWEKEGLEKLKIILANTSMDIYAEDIGVIPNCVEEILKKLKIPNLYVERNPKTFEKEFENIEDYPKLCVCTPSNHDMAPLRMWWEENAEKITRYYYQNLKRIGKPPKHLTQELAMQIIKGHLESKASVSMFLLQDIFAMSDLIKFPDPEYERINDPGNPHFKWTYRIHLYVEELLLARSFSKQIRNMIEESGR